MPPLATHQVGAARRTVDGLSGRFASLHGADLEPDQKGDAETRGALSTASNLLSRYQHLRSTVEASEILVFNATFKTLWDPKTAQKDEDQLYASVGKKYDLTGTEAQAIYRRNEAEADAFRSGVASSSR
jgi:hypothetical protein